MLNYVVILLSALVAGLVFIFLLRRLALKINLATAEGITYVGGPGMWLAFSVICIVGLRLQGLPTATAWGIILSSALIVIFGIIDDYKRELSVSCKFLVQCVATIVLIKFGIKTQIVHIGPAGNLLITFLWILGISNAFNHLDILDGLAGGIALISTVTFFFIALFNQNLPIAVLSLSLSAVTLSFLGFNLSKAKVYMGNSGSHFLGFVLAAMALGISYAPLGREIALLTPVFILGLPIYDTLFLILIRALRRKSAFQKSNDHFALRLIRMGVGQKGTLAVMYSLGLFFSGLALMVSRAQNEWVSALILVALLFLILSIKMGRVKVD